MGRYFIGCLDGWNNLRHVRINDSLCHVYSRHVLDIETGEVFHTEFAEFKIEDVINVVFDDSWNIIDIPGRFTSPEIKKYDTYLAIYSDNKIMLYINGDGYTASARSLLHASRGIVYRIESGSLQVVFKPDWEGISEREFLRKVLL